jgi:hypothetical protein
MEACEVVRFFVNKAIVPAELKRPGNPDYGQVKALRILVYARLKSLDNDTRIFEHLKKYHSTVKTLGLPSVPDRTIIGRWWKRYVHLLEQTFLNITSMLLLLSPTKTVIVNSTPLEDLYDMEATWSYTERGAFRGLNFTPQ